jgi:CheY-like chemotaxis protein
MPGGGTLTIAAENIWLSDPRQDSEKRGESLPYLMLSVTDTGVGISREIREKIFAPFFTTKELGKGTGLGLSSSLAIVKSHGGFIDVSSELGKGSAFQVYLPARITAEAPGATPEKSRLPRGNGELVLIVDDEPAIREVCKRTLQAYGYSVVTACDGAEAVELQSRHAASLRAVLIDMTMPLLDGPATIQAIFRRCRSLKFIAASGLLPENHLPRCPEGSVNAFLPKPYTAEALLTTLHDALQGNAAA